MSEHAGLRVVEPGVEEPRWVLHSSHPLSEAALDGGLRTVALAGGGEVDLWVEAVEDSDDELARSRGFSPYRDLWQLRCDLPAAPSELPVRSFRPEDADGFLQVNNRAFHWHPEQGGMTADDLAGRQAEPWYDAAGFLIHEREGRLAGFCWTKVHADTDPPMGEIYVIGVDPDFHGQGIGGPLTLAGLAYLADQGLTTGMLYVESDNAAANAVYERIGFSRHSTNRAYTSRVKGR